VRIGAATVTVGYSWLGRKQDDALHYRIGDRVSVMMDQDEADERA
jgi:hypothetical protein